MATLLSKPSRRLIQTPVDYMGFEIDDHFVRTGDGAYQMKQARPN